jgi:hypothetical protein
MTIIPRAAPVVLIDKLDHVFVNHDPRFPPDPDGRLNVLLPREEPAIEAFTVNVEFEIGYESKSS